MYAPFNLERLSTGHGILESPLWDAECGLLVADATEGGVLALDANNVESVAVAHRRGIGGIALHADGGIIVGGRNLAIKRPPRELNDSTVVLLGNDPANDIVGYNDLVVDSIGRIYIGSLGFIATQERSGKAGKLHLVDLDGSMRVVADDVLLTNGLGFSPDGGKLYHADSLRQVVLVYDVDPVTGDLGPRREFVRVNDAMPDGLTVDSAGTVWVAQPNSGQAVGYSPDGRQIASLRIFEPMVTNMCHGGTDLKDFYLVSGSEGAGSPLAGSVYRTRTTVAGLPKHRARIRYVRQDRGGKAS